MMPPPPRSTLVPYTTRVRSMPDKLFQNLSVRLDAIGQRIADDLHHALVHLVDGGRVLDAAASQALKVEELGLDEGVRSEEHTSELQSRQYLVCRLLLDHKTH